MVDQVVLLPRLLLELKAQATQVLVALQLLQPLEMPIPQLLVILQLVKIAARLVLIAVQLLV